MVDRLCLLKADPMTFHVRTTPRALLVGGALTLTLGLAACTNSHASTSAPSSQPPDSSQASSAANTTPTSSAAAPEAPLPLDAYENSLIGLSGSYADVHQELYQQNVKRENIVAACMKSQGFSYTPDAVESTNSASGQAGPSDADLSSKKWVEKYGYGDVYSPQGTTGEIQQAHSTNTKNTATDTSPNGLYVASLTPNEKAAYVKALSGNDGADSTLTIAKDWKQLGCSGKSLHTVKNENVVMHSAEGQAVQASMSAFYDSYSTWPGVAEAESAWSSCMTKNGHPGYSKQNEPALQFASQNTALWQNVAAGSQPSSADLDALATKERATALVDLSCRNSTHYTSTIQSIEIKQQKQFMSDNKAELDALKAEATAK